MSGQQYRDENRDLQRIFDRLLSRFGKRRLKQLLSTWKRFYRKLKQNNGKDVLESKQCIQLIQETLRYARKKTKNNKSKKVFEDFDN